MLKNDGQQSFGLQCHGRPILVQLPDPHGDGAFYIGLEFGHAQAAFVFRKHFAAGFDDHRIDQAR